jgi:predicted transcriptional regulator
MAKKLYAVSKSQRRVAMIMGVSLTTVNRYLKAAAPDDEDILKEEDISRMQDEIV